MEPVSGSPGGMPTPRLAKREAPRVEPPLNLTLPKDALVRTGPGPGKAASGAAEPWPTDMEAMVERATTLAPGVTWSPGVGKPSPNPLGPQAGPPRSEGIEIGVSVQIKF